MYAYKRMYGYGPAVEAASPTVFMFWLRASFDVHITWHHMHRSGPGSVVGIATGYGLDGPGIEPL